MYWTAVRLCPSPPYGDVMVSTVQTTGRGVIHQANDVNLAKNITVKPLAFAAAA